MGALLANYMVCRQAISLLPGRFAVLQSVKLNGGAELHMDPNAILDYSSAHCFALERRQDLFPSALKNLPDREAHAAKKRREA